MNVRWEHFVNSFDTRSQMPYGNLEGHGGKHGLYVREFASVVSIFQDRTDTLIDMHTEITKIIDELATCPYTSTAFAERLASVQKTIDNLNLEGYANLDSWVAELDSKIEVVLIGRLKAVIDRWCLEFTKDSDVSNRDSGTLASRKKAAQEAKVRQFNFFLSLG